MNVDRAESPTTTIVFEKPEIDNTSRHKSHPVENGRETTTTEKQPQVQEEYHVPQRSLFSSLLMVFVATLSMIINIGNSTTMAISLPTIGNEFNADPLMLEWIVSAYTLSSGCCLLLCGRLADLHGRKKTYLAGTFILAVLTLCCGFANNLLTLIILRGIQGIGAACTIPASVGILAHGFPPGKARSLAFATFSAGAGIGGTFGNLLGGVLTQETAATWRSVLYLYAGINVICFIGGAFAIDKDIPNSVEDKRIDWFGAFTIAVGLVFILFVLGEGENAPRQWSTGYIIGLLITGVFFVCVFIYWQWFLEKVQSQRLEKPEVIRISWPVLDKSDSPSQGQDELANRWRNRLPPPLMKLSLWGRAKGRFAAVMAIAFLTWSGFIGWIFWAQLYYQNYANLDSINTAVRLIPMLVAGIMCNFFVGFMSAHTPMIVITTVGTLCTAGACLIFALMNPQVTYWASGFPAAVLSVVGVDFVFSSGTIYIAKISLPEEQSLAAALFQTMIQLGTSIGVTVTTVVFNRVSSSLDGEDIIRSYKAVQWTCFGFAAFATLLSLVVFRGVGVPGDKTVQTPPRPDDGNV